MEQILDCLRRGTEELLFKAKNLFPNSGPEMVSSNCIINVQLFNPELPEDLAIDFSLIHQEIIISIYFLHAGLSSKNPTQLPSSGGQFVK
jgi:hypothetical protein